MTHLLDRIGGRRGHFRMESGLHAAVWFDLDQLFVDPKILDPAIVELAEKLRPYAVDAVCGPLVGGALVAQLLARALDVECYFTERIRTGGRRRGVHGAIPAAARLARARQRQARGDRGRCDERGIVVACDAWTR